MSPTAWLWAGVISAGILLVYFYIRQGTLFRSVAFTAFSGIGALGLLWLAGKLFPVSIPIGITPFTAAVSGILGIPGVLAMLVFNLI